MKTVYIVDNEAALRSRIWRGCLIASIREPGARQGRAWPYCKNIVDRHGWHISAANGPAGGAMITIDMPQTEY